MRLLALLFVGLLLLSAFADASPAQAISGGVAKRPENKSGGCNCRCNLSHNDKFCAVNSKREKQTFQNQCQLDCYNCTSDADFVRRYDGECRK